MTSDKKHRIQKYGEVFTPQWVVDKMCDCLQGDAWEPGKTFLEPSCGEGVFLLEVLRRKFANCKRRSDFTLAISSVWGMEIQPDNVEKSITAVTALCREYFNPTKEELKTINDHIIMCDSLKVMRMMNELNEREYKP